MGGWIGVGIGIAAIASLFWTNHDYLGGLAVASTIASLSLLMVMHYFSRAHYREWRRRTRENAEFGIFRSEASASITVPPASLMIVFTIFFLLNTVFLIAAIIMWII